MNDDDEDLTLEEDHGRVTITPPQKQADGSFLVSADVSPFEIDLSRIKDDASRESIVDNEFKDLEQGLKDEIGGTTKVDADHKVDASVPVTRASDGSAVVEASVSVSYREAESSNVLAGELITMLVANLRNELRQKLVAF